MMKKFRQNRRKAVFLIGKIVVRKKKLPPPHEKKTSFVKNEKSSCVENEFANKKS